MNSAHQRDDAKYFRTSRNACRFERRVEAQAEKIEAANSCDNDASRLWLRSVHVVPGSHSQPGVADSATVIGLAEWRGGRVHKKVAEIHCVLWVVVIRAMSVKRR